LNILAGLSAPPRTLRLVLSFAELAARPEFAVTSVTCHDDHVSWSVAESHENVRIVLVRQGRFRRSIRGIDADIDATVGYLGLAGDEERFAHPAGGDVCTSISLAPALWRTLAGDAPRVSTANVYVDAGVDLAHRQLLAALRTEDVDQVGAERLVGLIAAITERVVVGAMPGDTARGERDRALVAEARALINEDHPAATGLLPLAGLLGVSPYRLSKAFTRELGVSLTRYRNRVRVTCALDRLEAGDSQLAVLAADLGFADQAHLCRTMRDHLGHTPTAVRGLLRTDQRPRKDGQRAV
jgi:AraC-like DNA-binding protein